MAGHRLVLVDPISLKGKELSAVLAGRDLAFSDVVLLDRAEAAGTLSEFAGAAAVVRALDTEPLEPSDVVVFCGAPDLLVANAQRLEQRGNRVIDLTDGAPIAGSRVVLAGVNDANLEGSRWLRAPHPGAVVIGRVLHALREAAPVLRAEAVVFEPVAARGPGAIDELHQQVVELLSFRPAPAGVLGTRLAFNVVPASGSEEWDRESQIGDEVRFVLGSEAPAVQVQSIRAPVFLGLAVSLSLELEEDCDVTLVGEILAESPWLALPPGLPATPGDLPGDDGARIWVTPMAVRETARVRVWAATDWLRGGCLVNAVAILERLGA